MWDSEVDVAVIGAGIAGLANAITTVDVGGEVLVVDAATPRRGASSPVALRERTVATGRGLLPDMVDPETNEYFAAVTEGLSQPADGPADASVPRRVARNLTREEASNRYVEPFVGSRLTTWAEQCVTSPYGLMYTSMRDWRTTTMRSAGESIEVMAVGAIDWATGFGEGALRQWMIDQSRHRDIEVRTGTALQRIVFEEGVIVGVVLDTPDGPHAVRTRAGVTMSHHDDDTVRGDDVAAAVGDRLQVCLVGRVASRFGRVELLATEPSATRPTCTGSRRQLREGMHDARQPALEGWRCGKVQGYPALGQ